MRNGVILQRLETLEEVLGGLRSLGTMEPSHLESDWRTRRAVERDLQVAVEIVIDVAQRILAIEGQAPATTSADAVERCIALKVLDSYEPYRRMVQFRNFVVHRYDRVDLSILVDIVNHRLGDFERFREEVLRYAQG